MEHCFLHREEELRVRFSSEGKIERTREDHPSLPLLPSDKKRTPGTLRLRGSFITLFDLERHLHRTDEVSRGLIDR